MIECEYIANVRLYDSKFRKYCIYFNFFVVIIIRLAVTARFNLLMDI